LRVLEPPRTYKNWSQSPSQPLGFFRGRGLMPPEPLVFYTQSCILIFFIPCFFLEFLKCVFMVGIADVRLFSGCVVMARTGTGKSGWPLGFFWVFRNSVAVRGPPPSPPPRRRDRWWTCGRRTPTTPRSWRTMGATPPPPGPTSSPDGARGRPPRILFQDCANQDLRHQAHQNNYKIQYMMLKSF